MDGIVLSYVQVTPLLAHKQAGRVRTTVSPDLGLTCVEVELGVEGVQFPTGACLRWELAEMIVDQATKCFILRQHDFQPIQFFSEELQRVYTLMPTDHAPTMLIGGISMHRIKGTDPYRDTLSKIETLAPIRGRVLDTTTGLGYTAIEAAKTAEDVVTIELDPMALEVARLNPWSQALFANPKISQHIGDAYDVVPEFPPASFSCIVHDPPMFGLAGQLYAGAFYQHLHRVLRRGGKLFHYIGNPASGSGQRITQGVVRRLKEAGFKKVVPHAQAFGVVAYK
jgi:predicted methyltransferase